MLTRLAETTQNHRISFLAGFVLQQHFTELFSRQLPHHPFLLQLKERSQNCAGVQAGRFHDVVNMLASSALSNS
jgi:hypothetical protein